MSGSLNTKMQPQTGTSSGGSSASLAENLWTDDSGAFYVRVDTGSAISWLTPAGAASAAPGTGVRPAGGTSAVIDRATYTATAAGSGFAIADILDHIVIADPASGAIIGTFWLNVTQTTKLAGAPLATSILPLAPLPTNAAQETGGNLALIASKLPTPGPAPKAASQPVTMATDQPAIPVSLAAALPAGSNLIGAVQGFKANGLAGTIVNAASVVGPYAVPNTGALTLSIQGVHAGVNLSFWASPDGGATWYPVAGSRTDTGISEFVSGVLGANLTRAWDFLCGGATHFKAVATAWTSGTGNVQLNAHAFAVDPSPSAIAQGAIAPGSAMAGNPVPMAGVDGGGLVRNLLTDTTGRLAGNLTGVGGAALALGQGASAVSIPVTLATDNLQDTFITGQAAQSVLGNNAFLAVAGAGSTDTIASANASFRSFYTQIIGSAGIASGQIIFEGSNDNATFNPLTVFDDALVTGVPINAALSIAASTSRFFSGKTTYRYVRCRISTVFAGGTIQAFTRFCTTDYIPRVLTVEQAVMANLQATMNLSQIGGTAPVTAGLAGTLAVGGNVAPGSAPTANPAIAGTIDPSGLTRRQLSDLAGAIQIGNSSKGTYAYSAGALAITATPSNLAIVEAGAAKITRLRKLTIWNPGMQTTAGLVQINVVRTTTAGAAGTVTPSQMDNSDAAFSGIVRSSAGTTGTLGTVLYSFWLYIPAALASALPFVVDFTSDMKKAPVLPAGITNGLALQAPTGAAGATGLAFSIELTEE